MSELANQMEKLSYWPYDELTLLRDETQSNRFLIKTPWLKIPFTLPKKEIPRVLSLVEKIRGSALDFTDLAEVNWLLGAFDRYPLAYVLPRSSPLGSDLHSCDHSLNLKDSPWNLLQQLSQEAWNRMESSSIRNRMADSPWTWDEEAALSFARGPEGIDPLSLFSIGRRFHLLNDLEWNETSALLGKIRSLKHDAPRFNAASAQMIRQNHYITETCNSALSAAKPKAQNALSALEAFIMAEEGHHKILRKALLSLSKESPHWRPLASTFAIMEIFRESGRRNFLAFAMIVDIFERSSFQKKDPFAALLQEGGKDLAFRQLDSHRQINDEGNHENFAMHLLGTMAPVSSDYALEALRLAELATLVIHQISAETILAIDSSIGEVDPRPQVFSLGQ